MVLDYPCLPDFAEHVMAGPGDDHEIIYLYISELQSSSDTYLPYYLELILHVFYGYQMS